MAKRLEKTLLMIVLPLAGACSVEVNPPDTELRPSMAEHYKTCFEIVRGDTGVDISGAPAVAPYTEDEIRLARDRVVAGVNQAADAGSNGPVDLPYLLVRDWRSPEGELKPVYHLKCGTSGWPD